MFALLRKDKTNTQLEHVNHKRSDIKISINAHEQHNQKLRSLGRIILRFFKKICPRTCRRIPRMPPTPELGNVRLPTPCI